MGEISTKGLLGYYIEMVVEIFVGWSDIGHSFELHGYKHSQFLYRRSD